MGTKIGSSGIGGDLSDDLEVICHTPRSGFSESQNVTVILIKYGQNQLLNVSTFQTIWSYRAN